MSEVRVNECRIFATGGGADWWALWRSRMPAHRFDIVQATLGGDLVDVACDDAEDAKWLIALAISNGVTPTAMKVLRGGKSRTAVARQEPTDEVIA